MHIRIYFFPMPFMKNGNPVIADSRLMFVSLFRLITEMMKRISRTA